jgi:hypothetical protein
MKAIIMYESKIKLVSKFAKTIGFIGLMIYNPITTLGINGAHPTTIITLEKQKKQKTLEKKSAPQNTRAPGTESNASSSVSSIPNGGNSGSIGLDKNINSEKNSGSSNPQPSSVPAKIISFTVSHVLPENIATSNLTIKINGKARGEISVSEEHRQQKITISLPETQEYNIEISGKVDRYQRDKKPSNGGNQKSKEDIALTSQILHIENNYSFELKYREGTNNPLEYFLE